MTPPTLTYDTYTVLGASGFVGSHLTYSLKKRGANVFAPVRGDEYLFNRKLGCVIYCIGLTNDYANSPANTVEAHSALLARLLEYGNLDRLVYLSSTRLYDEAHTTIETQPLLLSSDKPRHLFDLSKALGENICLTASQGRATVARLSNVYSQAPNSPGFFSELIAQLALNKHLVLESSPYFSRDYVHIDDVIRSILALANNNNQEIINVASGVISTNREIANLLERHGWNVSFAHENRSAKVPLCDITQLQSIGIQPISAIDFLNTYIAQLHATRY
jgi:nucleoside-diphosphate-sugar epimerase